MGRMRKGIHSKARTRLQPDERRRLIVEAAFKAVAEAGFEGLRTRDIASSVGINSATLHHYFETKQDLIESIAQYLERRLQTERAPKAGSADLDPFGSQFDDLIFYQTNAPELLAVYREFVARAPRDAVIRELVEKLHSSWKASVVTALEQARAGGLLRTDVDIDAAAGLMLSTAWGLVAQIFVSTAELKAAAEQLRVLVMPSRSQSDVKPKRVSHGR